MSITLPAGLAKFFSIVSGMKWPEADEDRLRTAGDDYLAIAKDIPDLKDYVLALVRRCLDEIEGDAADAFVEKMRRLVGETGGTDYLSAAGDSAKELGDFAHKVANQVEYMKWMIIGQLIQLAAQIAWAIANVPLTFGASLATIFAAEQAAAAVIKQVFLWLLRQILLHEFLSITTGLMMDVIIQTIQIGTGHRKEWDDAATLQTLQFAAINGLLAGPLELVGFGFGKLFGRMFGKGIGQTLAGDLKGLAGGEIKNLAGGEVRNLAKNLTTTEMRNLARNEAENLTANELKNAAGAGLKNEIRTVGGSAGKTAGGNAAKETAGKAAGNTAKGAADGAAAKVSKVDKFTKDMGTAFEENLTKLGIGKEVANRAGQNFARTLASNGARYAVDQRTVRKLLDTVLTGLSKEEQQVVRDLAERTMGLAGGLRPQTGLQMLYKFGEGLGMYLKGGVQNILTEGTFNLVFGEDHEFTVTWETFVGGVSMGVLTHLGHLATAPLQEKFQQQVKRWDAESAETSDSKYYGPFHPRTLLALASNLSGNPTSLLIPRPMGPKARAELGLDAPVPVGTESSGSAPAAKAPEGAGSSRPSTSSDSAGSSGRSAGGAREHSRSSTDGPTRGSTKVVSDGGTDTHDTSKPGADEELPPTPTATGTAGAPAPVRTTGNTPGTTGPVTGPGPGDKPLPRMPTPGHVDGPLPPVPTPGHVDKPLPPVPVPTESGADHRPDRGPAPHGGTDHERTDRDLTDGRRPDDGPDDGPGRDAGLDHLPIDHRAGDDHEETPAHGRRLSEFGSTQQGRWIADPDLPRERQTRIEDALKRMPVDETRYTVAVHIGEGGAPRIDGRTLGPEEMARTLRDLEASGEWDPFSQTVEFVACGAGRSLDSGYVHEVMTELWKSLPDARARAADGPVWLVPSFSRPEHGGIQDGPGHLVVATRVGLDADGRPVIEGGGEWHEYRRPLSDEQTRLREESEPPWYLRPDPEQPSAPDHYAAARTGDQMEELPEAVVFGDPPTAAQVAAGVDLAQRHLTAAMTDHRLREFMGGIKAGTFTGKRGAGGMLIHRTGERFDNLMLQVERFFAHAETVRPPDATGAGETLLLYRAVKMSAQARAATEFLELLPSSTSFNPAFHEQWTTNGGGSANYVLFEIEVPVSHPMLALSFPPGHTPLPGGPAEVNPGQHEVTLGPSRLRVIGGPETVAGLDVVRVTAEPLDVAGITTLVHDWSSDMTTEEAFEGFLRHFSADSLRAAHPYDLPYDRRITERMSEDGREKTVEIRALHPKLAGQHLTITVRLEDDGSVSVHRVNSEDEADGRVPETARYTSADLHTVSDYLRGDTLGEHPSYEALSVPFEWFSTDPVPRMGEVGEPFTAFGGSERGWWLGDSERSGPAPAGTLSRFPSQAGVFTIAVHTDPTSGMPVRGGAAITADDMVGILAGLHEGGAWNGTDQLRFVACGLGGTVDHDYVTEVMRQLGRGDLGTSAMAATGTVYFVPPSGGGQGRGHLVVASEVGYTLDGRPAVVEGGHWLEFRRPEGEEPAPPPERRGAYLPGHGEEHRLLPDGYVAAERDQLDRDRTLDGAMSFGDGTTNRGEVPQRAPSEHDPVAEAPAHDATRHQDAGERHAGHEERNAVPEGPVAVHEESVVVRSVPDAVARALSTTVAGTPNGAHWLADPAARGSTASLPVLEALRRLPDDDRYFTIAYHGADDGAPTWLGERLSPEQLADTLLRLAEGGQWRGEPLRFLSCYSGRNEARSFAARTLTALHEALALRQADGGQLSPALARLGRPEAFAPGELLYLTGGEQPRAVTAARAGYSADGRPLIERPGDWHHLTVTEDGTVRSAPRAQELLRPDEAPVPRATEQDPITDDRMVVLALEDEETSPEFPQDPAGEGSSGAGSVADMIDQVLTPRSTGPLWSAQRERAWALVAEHVPKIVRPADYWTDARTGDVRVQTPERTIDPLLYDHGTGEGAFEALRSRLDNTPGEGRIATVVFTRPHGEADVVAVTRSNGSLEWRHAGRDEAWVATGRHWDDTHVWAVTTGDHVFRATGGDKTYVIRAENSGDMYHMRAAMVANPDSELLIWNVSESTKKQAEMIVNLHDDLIRSGRTVRYTTDPVPPPGRNETKASEDIAGHFRRNPGAAHQNLLGGVLRQAPDPRVAREQLKDPIAALTRGVGILSSRLREYDGGGLLTVKTALVKEFARAYGHYTPEEAAAFRKDLVELGGFQPEKAYVIVVHRDSGHSTRAGANAPALDTGVTGMRTLIEQAGELTVAHGRKAEVVTMGTEAAGHRGANLLSYWNWPSVGNRRKELSLLKYLSDTYNVLGAVGMRSGVMDQIAFAGIRIVSIDISPHRTEVGSERTLPNIKPSKGWTRGLKFEDDLGHHYGRVFITDPRTDDTDRRARDFQGEFTTRDREAIRRGIDLYLGEGATSSGARDASHPLNAGKVLEGLDQLTGIDGMTGIELGRWTLPYLNELNELKFKITGAEAEVQAALKRLEELHAQAVGRSADLRTRAGERCRQEVVVQLRDAGPGDLEVPAVTWLSDNEWTRLVDGADQTTDLTPALGKIRAELRRLNSANRDMIDALPDEQVWQVYLTLYRYYRDGV
ncbi:hypothetical protein ACFVHB_29930 [Kitasatospora sp. NPDC127111]|uniref:WXG100-like domain-containing protein n=1 Tax=Kitasatospora sp. NPDC127111 TaxID=3345363 RepID=UPI003633F21B